MTSQSSIAQTSFLEDCISKKRSFQDIYEALDLYPQETNARKEPVFLDDKANDLQKEVKKIAASFKASHRDDDTFLADLVKDGAFANQVRKLGQDYGRSLWDNSDSWPSRYGFQHVSAPDRLIWDRDNETICFYIRCWITKHAVQIFRQRKGKARASVATRDLSGSDHSDIEQPRISPHLNGVIPPDPRLAAPDAPSMLPPTNPSRIWSTSARARSDDEASPKGLTAAVPHSPTTPNKRKAPSVPGQSGSGKLQKVIKETPSSGGLPRGRQRDIYSVPTPAPVFQTLLTGFVHRSRREDTCDTDRTYAPPREATVEADDAIDQSDIMVDTEELSDIGISNDEASRTVRTSTAGPSGTYRSFQRHDSVIPLSTQPDGSQSQADQDLHSPNNAADTTRGIWQTTSVPTPHIEVSKLNNWQEKQLRMELFKLLQLYLNGLDQFDAESYEPEAEERMNHLLYQFWINDSETLRAKVGMRFPELQTAWECWINMRHQLSEFQRSTGYFGGRPGDDWKEHLRTMDCVNRAKACIAFVDLKSFAGGEALTTHTGPQFDNDIATVFDLVTQVEGCNGVEEFEEALRVYNEDLLEWFS